MICRICPHQCDLREGQTGFCRARSSRGGKIVCDNYGRLTALALDPIEKKPLARFFPGSRILSAGSYGCNLRCPFCQNSDISMADGGIPTRYLSPEELVKRAAALTRWGNIGLALTYNEPLVGYEYARDCAALIRRRGLKMVLVTNGMICREPLEELLVDIDAMNIDLKAFTKQFYRKIGGDLETVQQTIRLSAAVCHVEVTTLVIPGENDSEEEISRLSGWLASVDPEIPLHLSRFFPRYRMQTLSPTPVETVYHLRDIAAARLKYVYTGNC